MTLAFEDLAKFSVASMPGLVDDEKHFYSLQCRGHMVVLPWERSRDAEEGSAMHPAGFQSQLVLNHVILEQSEVSFGGVTLTLPRQELRRYAVTDDLLEARDALGLAPQR